MAIVRFQVRSFRGFKDELDYVHAFAAAQSMIEKIKGDKWSNEYWWAEIYDRNKCRSKIVWLLGNYCFMSTQWLHLR